MPVKDLHHLTTIPEPKTGLRNRTILTAKNAKVSGEGILVSLGEYHFCIEWMVRRDVTKEEG